VEHSPLSQALDVICIGAAALDMLATVDALPPEDGRALGRSGMLAGGGPAATSAVALARLGVRVGFVGAVGDDHAGSLIHAGLAAEGVDVSMLRVTPGATSALSLGILRGAPSETRTMVAYAGSAGPLGPTGAVADACGDAAWIHVDHAGFSLARSLAGTGIATPVSVDGGNPIPDLDLTEVALYAPSAAELLRWSGTTSIADGMARADAAGAAIVIATQGREGATARTPFEPTTTGLTRRLSEGGRERAASSRWSIHVPAFEAPIASSLGAGDVYHGAILAALLRGLALPEAMAYAAVAAALSCRGMDGRSGIPTHEEVSAMLNDWDGLERTLRTRIH
jgi:sulfofructose kinase